MLPLHFLKKNICSFCNKRPAIVWHLCSICHFLHCDYEQSFYEEATDYVLQNFCDAYSLDTSYLAELVIQKLPYTRDFKAKYYNELRFVLIRFINRYIISDEDIISSKPIGKVYKKLTREDLERSIELLRAKRKNKSGCFI